MTDKQFLNALIKGMEGSKNPVIYGTGLYLQFIESWTNPNNEYSDYQKDVKNIEKVEVNWKSWNNPEFCLHVRITRKNGSSTDVETLTSLNPLQSWYDYGKNCR
ncbi:MAG: hypothetical protein IKP77_04865 [Acholeplasmatales bacterium]|nr:hypothetical protein [Bacilli bacterium]MBR6072148.1 hypothetical protein [Acholeplasmatales bacterium]